VEDAELARKIEDTARWFGAPCIMVYQNQTPGLLPSEAERLGKITVGTELGWGRSVSPQGVRHARHGVLAAAIHHGQLRGAIEPMGHHQSGTQTKVEIVDRDCISVAPFEGHYEPLVACGSPVRRGDVIGLLHDFDHIDSDPWPAVAKLDGMLVAQAWLAPVMRGQHIALEGRIIT
jgi:N-alpha-acetyl-L-2,4-diaminobutyrate deacetylase